MTKLIRTRSTTILLANIAKYLFIIAKISCDTFEKTERMPGNLPYLGTQSFKKNYVVSEYTTD